MAINFPDAPVLDQVYTDPTCGSSWRWDGITWNGEGGTGGSGWFPSTDADNYTFAGTDGGVYTPTPLDPDLGSPVQLLERDLDLYVATTGNDTTGDGTQALPWATPHRAMAYLSKVVLATGVKAMVFVADDDYTFTQSLDLGHPQGTQIFINGTSTAGTRPTGAALNGGGVKGNTTATESFNNTKLRAYYNTRWQFNGCTGLFAELGGGVTVDKVLIRGNATANTHGVLAGKRKGGGIDDASIGSINLGTTVAVHNFGGNGVGTFLGGSIKAGFATVTNSGLSGITTTYGGSIGAINAFASNNREHGFLVNIGGQMFNTQAYACYNGGSGLYVSWGGSMFAFSSNSSFNGSDGAKVGQGGSLGASNSTSSDNGGSGYVVIAGGSLVCEKSEALRNAIHGIQAYMGGSIAAGAAITYGSVIGPDVIANLDGIIYFAGGSTLSNSPAFNTIGNGKGYIAI